MENHAHNYTKQWPHQKNTCPCPENDRSDAENYRHPEKACFEGEKESHLKPVILPLTSTEKITYKSSNKKVATVSAKGVIAAKKKGTATITVKSGKKSVKCKVTVK